MATLILTAVGTIFGGPLGGAIGALVGRQVDSAIIGGRKVEGPRLKELSVQTSSYGSALPLHFGRMRAAGTVIWSTELAEHREKSGGGKGRPSVTTYSYTASFAVALSSRPILGIGRVWADGNLLRGSAGDLKVGGTMRIHDGHGDQPADSLLVQAEGAGLCPAYRHTAYVVFEDLQLADFGNRLPSLTFEVLADSGDISLDALVSEILPAAQPQDLGATTLTGFTIDQGSAGDSLAAIGEAIPLSCSTRGDMLDVRLAEAPPASPPLMLPAPAAGGDKSEDVRAGGWSRRREPLPRTQQCGLRYYDPDRDYQPGLQRSIGRSEPGDVMMIELPATISAQNARSLADNAARRATRARDTIRYRVTEIDPVLSPGAVVRLPVALGIWRIAQWEWQADGVMLELVAMPGQAQVAATVDAGRANQPLDLPAVPTMLAAFEMPWDGIGDGDTPTIFAATSGSGAGWSGAALFARQPDGSLVSLGSSGRRRATMGTALTVLGARSALLLDAATSVDVQLAGPDLTLQDATWAQLMQGANRALLGTEVIQFGSAVALGGGVWRLSQLLRGRGGTEGATGGHVSGEAFVLIDDAVNALDPSVVGDAASSAIVASGLGDPVAVIAAIANPGITLRPLAPVRAQALRQSDGSLALSWIRRARGVWTWLDQVEAPLNEQNELWDVTFGDADAPSRRWQVPSATLSIDTAQAAALAALAVPQTFHIRQVGSQSASLPLSLAMPA